MKTNKQIRQQGIAKRVKKALDSQHPEISKKLSHDEILAVIDVLFTEIIALLRSGFRVIFEGYGSFFTRAIKRQCSNPKTGEKWMTYKRRIRFNPSPDMRKNAETDITEQEYENEAKKNNSKTPAS